jgi:hypothetical protein
MIPTPIKTSHRQGSIDCITLCILVALIVAFAPWKKAFAEEVSDRWVVDYQVNIYQTTRPQETRRNKMNIGERLRGTAFEDIASRVIDTADGTAFRLWQATDNVNLNFYQAKGDAGGFQFRLRM